MKGLLIGVLLGSCAIVHGAGAGFEVAGQVHYERFDIGGRTSHQADREFRVFVKDCDWLITTLKPEDKGRRRASFAVGREGQPEIVQITYFPNGTSAALVQKGEVPTDPVDETFGCLWLAFASSCYLKGVTNGMVVPFFDPDASDFQDSSLKIKASWSLQQSKPELPLSVTFKHDGFWRNTRKDGTVVLQPVARPYDYGFENAIYRVSGQTNVGRLSIPSDILFIELLPVPGGALDAGLRTNTIVRVHVNLVSDSCSRTEFVPEIPVRTIVSDRRPMRSRSNGKPVSYLVNDQKLPSSADIPRSAFSKAASPAFAKKNSLMVRNVLLVLTIIPIVMLVLAYLRREKRMG